MKPVITQPSCQFIISDPRVNASICGARSKAGSSYCVKHHAICHDTSMEHLNRIEGGRKAVKKRQEHYYLVGGRAQGEPALTMDET